MKRTILILISILVLTVLCILFVCIYLIPVLKIANAQTSDKETFLIASQSPDGNYYLEAYRTESGATVDFSIRVYLINGSQKQIIYDAYHEYEVEIVWINNSTVTINGRMLDISCGEKFDWRATK